MSNNKNYFTTNSINEEVPNTVETEFEEQENTIADKLTMIHRKEIITTFLTSYRRKSYTHPDIIDSYFLSQVKRNGININDLYEIMCNNLPSSDPKTPTPSKRVKKALLEETLSLANFKKTVKSLGYDWKNKSKIVQPLEFDNLMKTAKILYPLLKETYRDIYISGNINSINENLKYKLDEEELQEFYTVTISFDNSNYIHTIAELIDTLYQDKCIGVMVGIRLIEIRTKFPVKAKNIYRSLKKMIEEDLYNNQPLY